MVLLHSDVLAGNAARQRLLIAVSHVHLYFVKRSMSESIAMLQQVSKIHLLARV